MITTLRVSDGFLLFTAGVAIGCLLMVKRRCPEDPQAAARPVPESESAKADNVVPFGSSERKAG